MVTSFLGVLHLIHVVFAFFLFLVNDWLILLTVNTNNFSRDSDNSHITRYIRDNDGSCPDFGLGPNLNRADDLSMSGNQSSLTNRWMALPCILPSSTERHPMVEHDAFFNNSCFPNNEACSMVDEDPEAMVAPGWISIWVQKRQN